MIVEEGQSATFSLSPNVGPTAGGTTVTISGNTLSGATSVKFGAFAARLRRGTTATLSSSLPAGGTAHESAAHEAKESAKREGEENEGKVPPTSP